MADPRKISRLRRGLARGSVWLAIITSICYVTLFEPTYSANNVCDKATWTRVVVDPPLSGVKEPILIGSNAGYLFVIPAGECKTRGTRASDSQEPESEDPGWMSIVSDLFDRAWGSVSDRWNYYLRSNDEADEPLQAVVVPLSRVLCMYEDAEDDGSYVPCKARPGGSGEEQLVRIVERLADLLTRVGDLDLQALETVLTELRDLLHPPELDPATKEQLARIEEHLAGLLTRANALDLSVLETVLTEIRDQLSPVPPERATLLPVHLLVHFQNAQLSDPNDGLSGPGVVLEPLHERALDATVNTLRECATPESPVRIKPYGFASSTPFTGRDDTDDLNVMAANRRARAVYKALKRQLPDGSSVSVEEPLKWDTFEDMVKVRDECIESPSGERVRDSFLDRVVVLELQTAGRCAPADWARSIRCSDVAAP